MSFQLINSQDNQVLFSGTSSTMDFESGQFDDGRSDGILNIPLPYGNLRSQQWFVDGVRLVYSEYELTSSSEFAWKGDLELVTMYFNLKGRFSMNISGASETIELGNNEHNLFYGKQADGLMRVDDLRMRSFMVQFTKSAFFKIASDGNDALKRFADRVTTGDIASLSATNLPINLPIQTCIQSILNCYYGDRLKRMFYYSKAIELLVLQAEMFDGDKGGRVSCLKTNYDKERILFARDYLMERLNAPPTLTELARISGTNEFKLKRGFKEIFGITVFGYLTEVKMEMAKNDLLFKKKNASEIAYELGFSSLQHFSHAFKKKFGVSPSQIGQAL